ncbi:alpha/beta fold hydrolase [Streptantibioticus ferralitis]|uniref:Alpha/beta hydrolase n=1 Tax=Streptantibioticus ferralitis TaxID=236510 RepID=A0ABT5Z4W6_9ACTN|nr:alpha/beta hydrolase [Streptantibioticus ferralitis]MDF2258865.1 alpha/beta hydrolase [Streptantibioticus ferralitis]
MTRTALEQRFTPSGIQYFRVGDGDAGMMVFVHGWRDSAVGWQWTIDELARLGVITDWRVVLVQRKEVSRRDAEHAGLLDDFASQVVEVVRHVARPQEQVVLVGQSMGGPVAELAATQLADAVKGLVLVTPAPLAGTPLPADMLEDFEAGARELDRVTAALSRMRLARNTSDTTALHLVIATPAESERSTLQSLASWIGGHPQGRRPSPVTAPTLVVVTDDTFFSEEMLRTDVAGRFADASVAKVGDAGHFPYLERPEELARDIAEFLAKIG